MGKSGSQNLANKRLWISIYFVMVLVALWFVPARCLQCRIQRCNAEYVASTSPSGGLQEEPLASVGYCTALRAYSLCTRRTARGCRGDLVFHSAVFRIKELFSQHNCSSEGPTSPTRAAGTPSPAAASLCDYESWALASGPASAGSQVSYAHCGLFGDPHLRTFRDEFQTCKVEGAWPLIDNRYLSVQVTNVPVVLGSSATATSKITVIFKAFRGCTEQKVYQATTEDLPSAFLDGTRSGGDGASLWITERGGVADGEGRQVKIRARYVGTSIIVRQVGRYLTFAIRMPEAVLGSAEQGSGLQLCLTGCPQGELIGDAHPALPQAPPQRQAFTAERAAARCRETLKVEDVYFQSCVFDLLTTGDPQFSLAAFGALEDLKALPPSRLEQEQGPLETGTSQISNAAAPCGTGMKPHLLLLLLTLLLLLL
ncbi:hypothetical protein AGOR_G00240210 [Albula goreensis]|uniref:RGM domain family, member D n=1 Tax=Albula goreensis TaxID=1534307 RepID=A0A8T3CJQ2_9TELE|nr:hypothetical protein AGOR_G00240210 [Albula goreensis]